MSDSLSNSGDVQALKCADCARSDSLVSDLKPTDVMPIPAEALAGFPDGVPHARRTASGVNRRTFMGVAGAAGVRRTRRSSWALRATTMVDADMSTAPMAGLSVTPAKANTPAASGIAMTL